MTKTECRKHFLEKRKGLSDIDIHTYSELIISRFLNNFEIKNHIISVFLPIRSKKEINTYPLLDLKEQLNITIVLPVSDFSTNTIQHIVFEDKKQLQTSNYGIPEPQYGEEIHTSKIDLVLVPLLVCDKNGNRVGYGKGFYDRFLASCSSSCQFIGLSFFEPIEKIEDSNQFDIKLDYLITPNQLHHF